MKQKKVACIHYKTTLILYFLNRISSQKKLIYALRKTVIYVH